MSSKMSVSQHYFAERCRLTISQIWIVGVFCLTLFSQSKWNESELFEESFFAIALILTVIGSFGRIWSLAHIAGRKNDQLVSVGPYSMCRNPLYLFSLLAAIGIGLSTCTFTIPIAIVIGFAMLYPSVIRVEEERLASLYGPTFDSYCLSTPKFFPSFRNYIPAAQLLVDMRAFSRGLRDSGWFLLGILAVRINSELHEAGIGITFWKMW
jgi:protein-S-isoprenylcysteine O-methyltransferase Ste14